VTIRTIKTYTKKGRPFIMRCILSSGLSLWPLILKTLAPDSILARDRSKKFQKPLKDAGPSSRASGVSRVGRPLELPARFSKAS